MFSLLLITALLPPLVSTSCECGYRMRDTSAYYTHHFVQDFSSYSSTPSPLTDLNTNPATKSFAQAFTVQSWEGQTPGDPLPRQNELSNVWISQESLILQQQSYPPQGLRTNASVSVAAIVSTGNDFYHGSYRTSFKVEGAHGGSVGGFFWYQVTSYEPPYSSTPNPHQSDTSEIDIEVLTREPNASTIHYTTHPSLTPSGSLIPNASVLLPLSNPWTTLQQHRFDWFSNRIVFYQGSHAVHTTTTNVPNNASAGGGTLQVNLWADGGQWSGLPSTTNVTMTVEWVLVYYNTTASEAGTDAAFNSACAAAGGVSSKTVCADEDLSSSSASGQTVSMSLSILALTATAYVASFFWWS
ncbi:hypothetical protein MMC20_005251 [Loxospora ochrophaea]|nr:hypothetical protein [Loxospora ochrophaea]